MKSEQNERNKKSNLRTAHIAYPCACRICSKSIAGPDDAVLIPSYWMAREFPACKTHTHDERQRHRLDEALECQTIDADCNDCRHFKRGARIMLTNDDGSKQGTDSFNGECLKFNKPTVANINFATGHPCFEHRRTL